MRRWPLIISVLLLLSPSIAPAQSPIRLPSLSGSGNATDKPTAPDPPSPEEQIRQLRERLTAAETDLNSVNPSGALEAGAPSGTPENELLERRSLLYQLARAYEQQLEDTQKLQQARTRREQVERENREWTDFPDPPPYSVLIVDSLRDRARSLKRTVELLESKLAATTRAAERSEETHKAAEQRLRLAAEQLEMVKDQTQTTRLTWLRDLAHLRSRAMAASAAMLTQSLKARQEELAEATARLALAQRQLARAEPEQRFNTQDLDKVRERLETERIGLEAELDLALREQRASHRAHDQAVTRLNGAKTTTSPGGKEFPKPAVARSLLVDRAELGRVQSENADIRVEMLRHMLDTVEKERRTWEGRFAVVSEGDVAKAREAFHRLTPVLQEVRTWRDYIGQQIDMASGQEGELETRLKHATAPAEVARLRPLVDRYRERGRYYHRGLERSQQFHRLLELLQTRFEQHEEALPLSARLQASLTGASRTLTSIWEFELFAVEDTIEVDGQSISGRRSVTIGKMFRAILLLMLGYWASVATAKFVQGLAVRRLRMEEPLADILRKWTFAILFTVVLIVSLVWAKIPLTVFAFLGGALAIGIGFGTQNLLKNFISGLLVLIERPLRVGDLIEIDGVVGEVRSIGFRSSTIRDGNGMEMHIPNSNLLERNLSNWTYSNRTRRFSLKVGVAYGSPVKRVRDLLSEAAVQHGLVLKDPEPLVLLEDFGDNALIFTLYYWVAFAPGVNPALVGSDLRFMIEKSLGDERISLSYPQRDIHLDTARPIEIHVTNRPNQPVHTEEGGEQGGVRGHPTT
jgi:small-conductance mechanosensitive channel